jgi:hypothetical protein
LPSSFRASSTAKFSATIASVVSVLFQTPQVSHRKPDGAQIVHHGVVSVTRHDHLAAAQSEVERDSRSLARSIRDVGLLHPIVVTSKGHLVAGARRLEACRILGWKKIPVTVLELPND